VVGDERASAEPEATAELLLACAGLPLAIRICAARLNTRSGWTIGAMARRLRDEHRRLDELRAGDMAVRASFQVSFTSLPASAQPDGIAPADAFRMLGLWQGPSISATAAAALFGTREHLADDALEALVDAHLLESTSADRYKFHDLLRVYSSERAVADLSGQVRDAAVGRLLRWYVHTADAAATTVSPYRYNIPLDPAQAQEAPIGFATSDEALAWYDSERINLVAATRQAAAAGRHDLAWRLPAPLYGVFSRRGNWADCITTNRIALDSARAAGDRQGEAWVLNNLGMALGMIHDRESIGDLEQALAIRREIGDRAGEAQAANNLANAYEALDRWDEAVDLLQRALELNRAIGPRYGVAVGLGNLGEVLLHLDRAQEAVPLLQEAHSTFAEIGFLDGVGFALYHLGRCDLSLGHDADAVDHLLEALASHKTAGNRNRQAVTLRSLAQAQARLGAAAQARESWHQAAAIFEELGDSKQAAEVRAEQAASGIS
jgi:tetratricopeptide (TPR) repeat protein